MGWVGSGLLLLVQLCITAFYSFYCIITSPPEFFWVCFLQSIIYGLVVSRLELFPIQEKKIFFWGRRGTWHAQISASTRYSAVWRAWQEKFAIMTARVFLPLCVSFCHCHVPHNSTAWPVPNCACDKKFFFLHSSKEIKKSPVLLLGHGTDYRLIN